MSDTEQSPKNMGTSALASCTSYSKIKDFSPMSTFVWKNKAPPRVRFLAWLASKDRLQTRVNIKKKGIMEDNICEICHATPETTMHILFNCGFATTFWRSRRTPTARDSISSPTPEPAWPKLHHSHPSLLLASLEEKECQGLQGGDDFTTIHSLFACRADACLWAHRLHPSRRHLPTPWCNILSPT
jgi:hypothetical protein